jgi:dTDP-glucose 4,6-dehydratase
MKGIILAGGTGTRLAPATRTTNKHLLPIIERPMILYPLDTLKRFGITDIMIVSGGTHVGDFTEFFGDGSSEGVSLTYRVQKEAGGIAQALGLAKDFVGTDRCVVVLGDNVFDNDQLIDDVGTFEPGEGAFLFFKEVRDPNRFGVPTFDERGRLVTITEKPKDPQSNYACVGLYSYPSDVFDVIANLKPSGRGELELSDVNNHYISRGQAKYQILKAFWSDAGTPQSLFETSIWAAKNRNIFQSQQPTTSSTHLSDFDGKKILVFGGCGFIGSNFIRTLIEKTDASIVNYDKLTYSGNRTNVADIEQTYMTRYTFVQADIADARKVDEIFRTQRPDYVINFAAETHVDRSIHVGSLEFIQTNVVGVYNVLEAVKKYGVQKYLQVSTDEVYGELPNPHDSTLTRGTEAAIQDRRFDEEFPFHPNVPYSATKAGGDFLCNAYFQTWKVPVVVTHCSNNYGPYQYPEKLVPYWATRLLRGEKIPVYGDGLHMRDWIHVDDHVEALILLLAKGRAGEVYNIGSDNERTNLEMAELIVKVVKGEDADPRMHMEFVADRPGHDRRYAIDHAKITREFGWKPVVTAQKFPEKIKETVQWYWKNRAWVEDIIARTGVANAHIDLWKGHEQEPAR